MRRWVALAAAVLIVPATPAAAAPRHEQGVRVSETSRYVLGGKPSTTRIEGRLRLASSGPVAVGYTWRDGAKPYRVIRVGKNVYVHAAQIPGPVPEGKSWVRFPGKHRGSLGRDMDRDASLQPIDVYDRATLKALLKRSTRSPVTGGFLHRGTITYRDLSRISKTTVIGWTSGRPISGKGKVSWRLWTGRDGRPRRLLTTDTVGALVKRTDTRYTWGSPPVIAAPPAGEVIDEDGLRAYEREQNRGLPQDG
ncbi:hypothetical protein AB0J42_20205 [Nonomuraea sp. NPDC049649]|uniref:hypothetical protein n=1 Tax=Nonomuraea sp. NPDC049649 TaxID=3155776 RepID=UPI00342D0FE9